MQTETVPSDTSLIPFHGPTEPLAMLEPINGWLEQSLGVDPGNIAWVKMLVLGALFLVLSVIVWFVTRRGLLTVVNRLVRNSKTQWDDVLLENRFFSKLAYIVPTFFAEFAIPQVLIDYPDYVPATLKFVDVAVVWIIMAITIAFLSSVGTILESKAFLRDKPIASYIQLGKIATYFTCGIIMVSLLVEKSPIYFFSALGAMTAVLLLIFKDTILGFVASIQLSAHDMVRMGDWVSMPKYGADGDIIEINLATIKVRNFDMTITTIPTYAFISDSFTNWRGMTDSNGRRIKRSLSIKISSIKFCSEAMLEQFSKYELIEPYIREKRTEIDQYNTTSKADKTELINGRHLTNIGVFRVYVDAYLRNNPRLNQEMTCMVRQLAPTEHGVPIEIYAFSADKAWVNYEHIIADIFDHIFAAVPNFELEVFESPTGTDFGKLIKS